MSRPPLRSLRRLIDVVKPSRTTQSHQGPESEAVRYAPHQDGRADPGEVLWAWVPYEDDPAQGKDRPVLLIGGGPETWLGLYLTSKDHDRDKAQEASVGRYWMDVGSGGWDVGRRPSEVRLDRLLRLDSTSIRRIGSALETTTFERVVEAAKDHGSLP